MIKTTAILLNELKDYANPTAKIRRLVDHGDLIPIVRGVYETNPDIPGYYLASVIYGPSYLSFEFALSFHSLIPEAVRTFTSATFEKRRAKQFQTPFGMFTYRDIPSQAYPYGVDLYSENGYSFQIASAEKAVCDHLYKIAPLSNRTELEQLLFEDLRIDQDMFFELNFPDLLDLAARFQTKNHKLLQAYISRGIKNGSNS